MSDDPYRFVSWLRIAVLISLPIIVVLLVLLVTKVVTAGANIIKSTDLHKEYYGNTTDYFENQPQNKGINLGL